MLITYKIKTETNTLYSIERKSEYWRVLNEKDASDYRNRPLSYFPQVRPFLVFIETKLTIYIIRKEQVGAVHKCIELIVRDAI